MDKINIYIKLMPKLEYHRGKFSIYNIILIYLNIIYIYVAFIKILRVSTVLDLGKRESYETNY